MLNIINDVEKSKSQKGGGILKKWFSQLKQKDGWVSLLVMCFIAVLLPLFLFFLVEMNHLWSLKDKAQYINDNMASASVRSIDKELLAEEGIIKILPSEAEQVAEMILKESYQLNDDFSLPEKSFLKEPPVLKVYTVNHSSVEGMNFTTDEGRTFKIYEPTVIVYSSIKPKGIFFNRMVDMQSYSLFQIKINPNIPTDEDGSSDNPTDEPALPEENVTTEHLMFEKIY